MNKNQVGLTLGLFAALVHLVWLIAVSFGIQKFMDWILLLHSIRLDLVLLPVNWMNSIALIVIAFVDGYILGWLFAAVYNWAGKCCKKK